jgi:hypothetical protein
MGRRQGGVGEASSLCFFGRGQSEDASPTHRNPLGRGHLAVFPSGQLKQLWFCQKRKNLADQSPGLPPIDNAMIETERQFGLQAWLEPA